MSIHGYIFPWASESMSSGYGDPHTHRHKYESSVSQLVSCLTLEGEAENTKHL